jgi:hypothetical protein
MQVFGAPEHQSDEVVEADEVIHVGVGDEQMGDLEELSLRERMELPRIEEQTPSLVHELHVQDRVSEMTVDELRMKYRAQALSDDS